MCVCVRERERQTDRQSKRKREEINERGKYRINQKERKSRINK